MKKKLRAVLAVIMLALGCAGVFAACRSVKDLSGAQITLSETTYVYDGMPKTPDVTVKLGGKEVDPEDISIAYTDNINAGTATVTVSAVENSSYEGSKTANFTITQGVSEMSREVYLNGVYNQKLGDVIGTAYNIASTELTTGETLTADTVLTLIGKNKYSFKSLYTPADANYAPFEQTVYITVGKANPTGYETLLTQILTAELGAKYSTVQAQLPAGVEVKDSEKNEVFARSGRAALPIIAKQIVEGVVDDEHYKVLDTTIPIEVNRGRYTIGVDTGYDFLYDNLNFDKSNMTVNGDIDLDGQYDLYKNWTFSITLSYDSLTTLEINSLFTNVNTISPTAETKVTRFSFTEGKCSSALGTRNERYDVVPANKAALSGDDVWLPEGYAEWDSVKLTVKTFMPTSTISDRKIEIYIGDGASTEDGQWLFKRTSGATYPRTLQLKFAGATNVAVTDISITEQAYSNDKLLGASKMQQYLTGGTGTTIDPQYTQGGLLMIGDSLVDYWGISESNSTSAITKSKEMYQYFGYDASKPVVNLGIGSATAEGWLNYLESCENYFTQFHPEAVYMLIGCNQIGNEDDKNISDYVIRLIERVRELYPTAKIVVNSLMPTTTAHSRWARWSRLAGANVRIKAYAEGEENVYYLDVENLFTPDRTQPVSDTNAPIPAYFRDGLHYVEEAYKVWTREVMNLFAEIGVVSRAQVNFTVEDADGGSEDISAYVKQATSAFNGHLVIKLELLDTYFRIEDIKLGVSSIKTYYDEDTKYLTYLIDPATESVSVTVTLKAVDDPDDNTVDDGDFQTP